MGATIKKKYTYYDSIEKYRVFVWLYRNKTQ